MLFMFSFLFLSFVALLPLWTLLAYAPPSPPLPPPQHLHSLYFPPLAEVCRSAVECSGIGERARPR